MSTEHDRTMQFLADELPTIETLRVLRQLVDQLVQDRQQLLAALDDVQRVAAWMVKRGEGRGQDEILDIVENALAQLLVRTDKGGDI